MPSINDRGVHRISNSLEGKRVAIGICGGIGSVETVKIIREIRRYGAEVTAFMTPDALKFITALSIEWACHREVIVEDGAQVEHLEPFDMVVVAPATFNSISKAALGICDNPVALLIASQLGKKGKLLFVPTMNQTLWQHPAYKENETRLKNWGAKFLETPLEEDRLKMPDPVLLGQTIEKELLSR